MSLKGDLHGQYGSRAYKVVGPPHAKDTSGHNRVADVVDRSTARVEQHGDGADELRDENGNNGLPPVESNTNQARAQGPVAKRQGKVKDDVVVPCG
jgi:hypothetical protein